ncbi:fumarylacetoacetate hydrolase family protein [Phyllobacterium sp. SB3]|uniref:fumarylacetoacetate hydrolase family protein n=1 Tax=Phyllobacterium sp. SB3 TaxID=3156073 RepID=UPI0032AF31E6
MRLLSFEKNGGLRAGVVEGDEVIDLTFARGKLPDTVGEIIRRDVVNEVATWIKTAPVAARLPLDGLHLALPFSDPGKVICLGLNYADHAAEGGHDVPSYPALFMRGRTSLIAAGQPMVRPACSERLDYEAELMLVVGRGGRHLTEQNCLDAVFGYTLFNDGSVRDYQRKSTQWTAGKNFDGTGAIGPWIVTADELPTAAKGLAIRCLLNGEIMQSSNTERMIFDVRRTLVTLSEVMTLEPGDLIALGTPDGVGNARKPPVYLKPGDTVVVEVDGIGRLKNSVIAATAA